MLTELVDGEYRVFFRSVERIELVVGAGQSLAALDVALPYVKVGSVVTLVVPSELAYGDVQVGNVPPQTPLLLQVKVLSATD
jgi:FKBP-type peptidyl-prolyl cis-trans isomerase